MIDGKAKIDGGVEKSKTWNNIFIMTGEQTASDINSGGGTLNRLVEIYTEGKLIKNGIKTCEVLEENYGFAGKIFVDFIKKMSFEELNGLFKIKYNELMALDTTEEKQAINMAVLLLADELACECIFDKETPIKASDVFQYMFSKQEIDNTERAYQVFLDECTINASKFNVDNVYCSEFWGVRNEYEITIINKKLRDILTRNGFNYNKIIKEWANKGLVEKDNSGKFSMHLMRNGIKGNYIIVKNRSDE